MPDANKKPTAAQKAFADSLKQRRPRMDVWRAARQRERIENAQVGDQMPDGTIYAGLSPEGRRLYTTPLDENSVLTWSEAVQAAQEKSAHGHQDWRLPTRNELSVLFNNKAKIGGFEEMGTGSGAWYWSSEAPTTRTAINQRFTDGYQAVGVKENRLDSVRLVRG